MCGMAGCIAVSRCMQGLEAEQWKFLLRVLPVLAFGLALMGALVLLTRRLLWPLDSLREGLAAGFGQVFHPSGQVLYTGQVYDAKPRADAFLGLSLAEVESAFSEHWQLYSCEEKTGFVYPTFGLIFVTDCPVTFRSASAEAADVVPPVQTDMAESDSAAIPAVFPGTVIAQDGGKERPMPPQPETPEGETLSPDTVHSDLVICEVLSYREPLPGTVQPSGQCRTDGYARLRLAGMVQRLRTRGSTGRNTDRENRNLCYPIPPADDAAVCPCRRSDGGGRRYPYHNRLL